MYTIRTATHIADAQISDLTGAEREILAEVYEVLRLTPENGTRYAPTGNMFTWDHSGLSVVYFVLEEQREVCVVSVDRWPWLGPSAGG